MSNIEELVRYIKSKPNGDKIIRGFAMAAEQAEPWEFYRFCLQRLDTMTTAQIWEEWNGRKAPA